MKEKEKKPIFKKWWFWVIIILLVIIIIASQGGNDVQTSTNTDNTNNKPVITWTNYGSDNENQQLLVAVEPSDNYEGDTVNAGTYIIKQTNTTYEDQTERIYNIYITDEEPTDFDEVSLEQFVGSVGGVQNENELEIEVKKGQFIIFSLVQGGENGHIEMFKK